MSEIIHYYQATRHDDTTEDHIEMTGVEETPEAFIGKLENGGERRFLKAEWKSVEITGFRPFFAR